MGGEALTLAEEALALGIEFGDQAPGVALGHLKEAARRAPGI